VRTDRAIPIVDRQPPQDGIAIVECGEPLAAIVPGDRLHVAPAYHERGIRAAPTEIRVRQRVLAALRRAAAALPAGVDLLVWDGLRTLQTQREIVEAFAATLPASLRGPARDEEVARYLALPPASREEYVGDPPPHSTGGAVDLTLCDPDGRPLDLGADFDQFDEASWLAFYEPGGPGDRPGPRTADIRARRRLLYWTMLGAGFAPYPWEYWHYELGTRVAAAFHGESVARYGAAAPWPGSDELTGAAARGGPA
jgi:D-alanyl-D-alanine dipeptidase